MTARLAQSVEHETLNLRVVGSSPTLGDHFFFSFLDNLNIPIRNVALVFFKITLFYAFLLL